MRSRSKAISLLKLKLSDKMKSRTTSVLKNLKMKKMLCLAFKKTLKEKVFYLQTKKDLIQNVEISTDVPRQNMSLKKTKASTKRLITQSVLFPSLKTQSSFLTGSLTNSNTSRANSHRSSPLHPNRSVQPRESRFVKKPKKRQMQESRHNSKSVNLRKITRK